MANYFEVYGFVFLVISPLLRISIYVVIIDPGSGLLPHWPSSRKRDW